MTAALFCRDVSKSLGGRMVLSALNLEVNAGEVVSLLGASGSGKTTLLRIVAGLANPDSGVVSVAGREVWNARSVVAPEQRRIGMVFQDYALWPHMTVAKNLSFGLRSQGLNDREIDKRVSHALEVARLSALRERYPSELSGGQQQRVAIARCLAGRPSLMLFDEPLSNLDAALREDMRMEMMELVRDEGTTVLYVTHDQADAMAVSDRIAIMRAGSIAQLDTPQRIYDTPADPFVANFIGGFSLIEGQAGDGWFKPGGDDSAPLRTISHLSGNGLLVVRPEDARPRDTHPTNVLKGIVQARAFQGRCWRLSVAVGPQRLRLDWPEGPAIGSAIEFSLPPERCLILAT
ncbi:ABC-type Fe3+/spermidine/putrescine transport system ATPase subunit [Devosia sp. UYZn731]|uniref:ABC transporter ATP-binding protein n=1 Tax=Devosia sp. UYZn731 TaxID=3156345 RepID=UPI00339B9690